MCLNSTACLTTRLGKFDHITPVLAKMHWSPIPHQITYGILTITYKAHPGLAPPYITNLLYLYIPPRSLRSSNSDLTIRCIRTNKYGGRTFIFTAPTLYNSLPTSFRQSCSLPVFKSCLKSLLFQSVFPDQSAQSSPNLPVCPAISLKARGLPA